MLAQHGVTPQRCRIRKYLILYHMDLFRIQFHDFPPKPGILQSAQPLYLLIEIINLLYKDHTVSVWRYHNSENPYHPSPATCLAEQF